MELDDTGKRILAEEVFPAIAGRECILLLGAGASVSNKKYLSADILDFWREKEPLDHFGTNDIIELIDICSADPEWNRNKFDDYIFNLLDRLKPTDAHRILVQQPWREIITTNLDLVVERAFTDLKIKGWDGHQIVPIRMPSEYNYQQANDEIRYVKLHGCISDRRRFRFAFSTADFQKAQPFYKRVLSNLQNPSSKIQLLTIGYSFLDDFGKKLLAKFDSYISRQQRWLNVVDPFVTDAALPLWTLQRKRAIRATTEDFFKLYEEWAETEAGARVRQKGLSFERFDGRRVTLPNSIVLRLGDSIQPISPNHAGKYVSPQNFYRGQEPTFAVVKQGLDVVKQNLLNSVKETLKKVVETNDKLVPIVFLVGDWGQGKSTFGFRLIGELLQDADLKAVAFEVTDPARLKAFEVFELFRATNAQNVILFFNNIEPDSAFKGLRDFRLRLSEEQFDDGNLVILATIRTNILHLNSRHHSLMNSQIIPVDCPFVEPEVADLIGKLEQNGEIDLRSADEKIRLVEKTWKQFKGDSLLSIMELVPEGQHRDIIAQAMQELSPLAQESLKQIALLHQFGISMPVGLLRALTGKSWDDFRTEVIEFDSKEIIVQEEKRLPGLLPDIYLRTRHRMLARKIVEIYFGTPDARFQAYLQLARKMPEDSLEMSHLAVNWFKAIRQEDVLSQSQFDKLFDETSEKFANDPHFTIQYTINLEKRNTEESCIKGIDRIIYTASQSSERNHYLTHRRGSLNFRLAKLVHKRETGTAETEHYLHEARRSFEIKLNLDPCSSFSYENYIELELWALQNIHLSKVEEAAALAQIETLFEQSEFLIRENLERVRELKNRYVLWLGKFSQHYEKNYQTHLEQLSEDSDTRPYAYLLQYYDAERSGDAAAMTKLIGYLEQHNYLQAISAVLLRHYGRILYKPDARQKLITMLISQPKLIEKNPVRTHFYRAVVHFYNRYFNDAYNELRELRTHFTLLNPRLGETWRDSGTGEPKLFEAALHKRRGRWRATIIDFNKTFDLKRAQTKIEIVPNVVWLVKLHFNASGIKAEVVERVLSEEEKVWADSAT